MDKQKERILVADDDAVIREGVRRVLSGAGYDVETVSNGRAALERLEAERFKLLVTDLKMPGMSGLEVLQAIRTRQPELPVILPEDVTVDGSGSPLAKLEEFFDLGGTVNIQVNGHASVIEAAVASLFTSEEKRKLPYSSSPLKNDRAP